MINSAFIETLLEMIFFLFNFVLRGFFVIGILILLSILSLTSLFLFVIFSPIILFDYMKKIYLS